MNEKQAIAKLKKLLGPKFVYRVNEKAPSAEQREAARALQPELTAARVAAGKAREERFAALLAGDVEYQRLNADYARAKEASEGNAGRSRTFRLTVGLDAGLFFSVKAEGDNWDDVVAKLTR